MQPRLAENPNLVPFCLRHGISMELKRGPEDGTQGHPWTCVVQQLWAQCSSGHHGGHYPDRWHRGPAGLLDPFVKPLELSQDPEPKVGESQI